jgi:Putative peptidoglycan binding domain/Helix-turn-helix domain
MSRWKPLPDELDPRVRQLITQMRRLKDVHELGLAQVAARTGHSKSSWERYFAGRNLPPREAVEAFALACEVDPTRLLTLHEVAADAWQKSRRPESKPGTADEAADSGADDGAFLEPQMTGGAGEFAPEPAGGPRRRTAWWIAAGATALVVATAAVLLTVRPWQPSGPDDAAPPSYSCHITRDGGHWYAGESTTTTAILQVGMAGPKVAEVQCLLRRAGYSPGDVDGIYGDLTQRAVKRFQAKHGLVVDGVVGQHTWPVLRG